VIPAIRWLAHRNEETMKYNQPYGISDPNAVYINGNPTTGTMGSIPPAESIEYDQREIVAVIQWAADHGYHDMVGALCANPSNADLQQLLKAIWGLVNSNKLTAPQTYYVNTTTGNDNNPGTSSGAAFKTIQRAVNQCSVFNLNGFNIQIVVADGTYGKVILPNINGTGYIFITGNSAIPGNCIIHANAGPALQVNGQNYVVTGFRFESDVYDSTTGFPGAGIWNSGAANFTMGGSGTAVEFGFCADGHIMATVGAIGIAGGTAIRIKGNSANFINANISAWVFTANIPAFPTIVIPEAHSIGVFINCAGNANTGAIFSSFSGAANVTGQKYSAATNATINSNGGGINYYPGTIAGVTGTGGQYL
jgi:hypothetical protein